MTPALRTFYPPLEPYRVGHLEVGDGHTLYFEESGNPKGKPVVFLHGGPGSGTEPRQRRFFDPAHYRIVLFDQRGAGKSTPFASLEHNTTWHLVADLEQLREHLGIERWQVFGGSWGSTLAHAQTHPARVTELVLRGIFLVRPGEIEWFYQGGCSALFPDAWEEFIAPIPPAERSDLVKAYYRRLTGADRAAMLEAARAWSVWEGRTSYLVANPAAVAKHDQEQFASSFARIECHYFMHQAWLTGERELLANIDRIRHIPAVIVQGRYDVVCPMQSAWALHRAWPEATLDISPTAGHSVFEPENLHRVIQATDAFR
ncbi:MAG: prolyl aminopeptidase [Archangiaceae bacterium]|nr:prolyl aminopeptidase [Archangiaceae bacterium]